MNIMSFLPLTREQLQAEGVDGNKRAQVKAQVQRFYAQIVQAARNGQKEFFFQFPSHAIITHDDIIRELTELFPGVTISSIQQKGTAQMVYQHAGILLDWS
jgi:urease gamma subunit